MTFPSPNRRALAEAASELENRAAELRGKAEQEARRPLDERNTGFVSDLRLKADWFDEVASYLDDVRQQLKEVSNG